jgi:enoyl-CoA hydratase/carnithine racemase
VDGFGLPRAEGMEAERANYAKVLASQDRLEGLRAFAEKRKPEYKGL